MKLSDFDYDLPSALIAQYPTERREESRLVVLDRRRGEIRETRFINILRYLQEGDLLVINETKVIPARLFGRRRTGGKVEVFITRRVGDGQWIAMLRPSSRLTPGEVILVGERAHEIEVMERRGRGEWLVRLPADVPEQQFIDRYGHVPLPPYIKRSDELCDRERYQTVFARREGSVAAPTAGLHFSEELLRRIKGKGITIVPLTLHVGPGTFRPLVHDTVEENTLSSEYLTIRSEYWREVTEAKRGGRRVLAVGTTTTRALEALALDDLSERVECDRGGVSCICGWTDLFIYPGFEFQVVDALLTNLHLPRSSLLLLVAAFAGREEIIRAYRWAIARRFRFYSYGDAMFIR
jgi:S-adenosylmethionine:tRNA ribosyltransferase-isomerase